MKFLENDRTDGIIRYDRKFHIDLPAGELLSVIIPCYSLVMNSQRDTRLATAAEKIHGKEQNSKIHYQILILHGFTAYNFSILNVLFITPSSLVILIKNSPLIYFLTGYC